MTTPAREEILGRIRRALHETRDAAETAKTPEAGPHTAGNPTPALPPAARAAEPAHHEAMVTLFVERTADYRAVVERCRPEQVAQQVAAALHARGARRVVIPPGLDRDWLSAVTAQTVTDDGLTTAELDGCDAVVTAASVGIAETGTIVLDHTSDQGRRALTLVPDVHVCVVSESQVTADVPGAIRLLRPAIDAHRALTWISGPSATSDIELNRIEGVHGPRHLHVVVVAD